MPDFADMRSMPDLRFNGDKPPIPGNRSAFYAQPPLNSLLTAFNDCGKTLKGL
jgi:hypothetical protein